MAKRKRLLSIVTAILMITLFLGGCTSTGEQEPNEPADATAPASSQEPSNEAAEEKELIPPGEKLTYWTQFTGGVLAASPADVVYYQKLQEVTGIELEFISNTGSGEQLSILAAADDLPDMIEEFWPQFPGGIQKSLADGFIMPLNDLMEQGHLPNFAKYLESDPEVDKMCKTDDGIYYNTPMIRLPDSFLVFSGMMLREDWLKDLGLTVPTTIPELGNVLTQFKDKKGATAPFSAAGQNYDRLLIAYGIFEEDFYVGADGKITYAFIEPSYKDFLTTFSSWMASGLIDPDIFTQNDDAMFAKIATKKIGMLCGYTGSTMNKIKTMQDQNPAMHFIAMATPSAKEGEPMNVNAAAYRVNQVGTSITADCKYPEAAAKIMDYPYSEEGHMLANFGVEGESYTMVNGYPTMTELVVNNPDGYSRTQVIEHYSGSSNKPFLVDKRNMEQLYQMQEQIDSTQIWANPNGKVRQLPLITRTTEETAEWAAIMSEIQTYADEMKMKFIIGTEPIDKFDDFAATIKSMGIDRAIEIQQAALDRFNSR